MRTGLATGKLEVLTARYGGKRYDQPNDITHEVDRPNGIAVSADDRCLYVADNNNTTGGARKLWRFSLRDGTIPPRSRKLLVGWRSGRGPDGIVLDQRGRLYGGRRARKTNLLGNRLRTKGRGLRPLADGKGGRVHQHSPRRSDQLRVRGRRSADPVYYGRRSMVADSHPHTRLGGLATATNGTIRRRPVSRSICMPNSQPVILIDIDSSDHVSSSCRFGRWPRWAPLPNLFFCSRAKSCLKPRSKTRPSSS